MIVSAIARFPLPRLRNFVRANIRTSPRAMPARLVLCIINVTDKVHMLQIGTNWYYILLGRASTKSEPNHAQSPLRISRGQDEPIVLTSKFVLVEVSNDIGSGPEKGVLQEDYGGILVGRTFCGKSYGQGKLQGVDPPPCMRTNSKLWYRHLGGRQIQTRSNPAQ